MTSPLKVFWGYPVDQDVVILVCFFVACVMVAGWGFLGEEFWAYLFGVMVLSIVGFLFYGILAAGGWVMLIL